MIAIAKYMIPMGNNNRPSREIKENCIITIRDGIIENIEEYTKYDLKEHEITFCIQDKQRTYFYEEIIPSSFKKYSAKEKHCYMESSILVPGLINSHTHSFEALFEGAYTFDKYNDGLFKTRSMLDWLCSNGNGLIRLVNRTCIDSNKINNEIEDNIWKLSYRKFQYDQLGSGITFCRDHVWNYGGILDSILQEKKTLQVEGITAIDCTSSLDNTYIMAEDIINKYPNEEFELAGTDNDLINDFSDFKKLSDKYDIGIHLHCCETQIQRNSYETKNNIEELYTKGILGERTSLAHCVYLDNNEYKLLSETRTKVVINNRSNGFLGSGKSDLIGMSKSGISCVLGTDGPASIGIDMLSTVKEAIVLERMVNRDPTIFDCFDALYMVTLGAAKAINKENLMGSIEKGKKANFFISRLKQPIYNPLATLIFSSSKEEIISVCVNGIERKSEKSIVGIDYSDVNEKIGKFVDCLCAKEKKTS